MKMYQVDAFSKVLFQGNPAAVIVLDQGAAWLDDALMQNIALENNLAETAFVRPIDADNFEIRWFSPYVEVAFCGHATLASAFVLFKDYTDAAVIHFHVKNLGLFIVHQAEDGKIHMNFPMRRAEKLVHYPAIIHQAIDRPIVEVYINAQAYILVCATEADVREAVPNLDVIRQLAGPDQLRTAITASQNTHFEQSLDVAVTANAEQYDYVARYFAPHIGIDEDPVTGSMHTGLAPFWAERLGKTELLAFQASARGGELYCVIKADDRVEISGYAKLYMQAEIVIE